MNHDEAISKHMQNLERRIEALEKRTWDSGFNQGAHEGMIERIAKLENSIASLKLCVPPPEVESVRCDCNQTSFVGHAEKAQTRSDE